MNRDISITFITPCFCRGADCSENGQPEIRPPSIRGQLHWWFRALGGSPADENAIFGSIHGGKANASPLVVRVRHGSLPAPGKVATLPHKTGGHAAPKSALPPGTRFDLLLSTRLGGLTPELEKKFTRALDAWLHLGALGLRATRGGGNFTWDGAPATFGDYAGAIAHVIAGTPLRATLLEAPFKDAEAARRDISDTIGGRDDRKGSDSLQRIKHPLGKVFDGRKTSPLRFRVVKFSDGAFRIAAIWDGRENVTRNIAADLREAIRLLGAGEKNIGRLLAASPLAR